MEMTVELVPQARELRVVVGRLRQPDRGYTLREREDPRVVERLC